MTTYNTGNPLGSAAAKDLYDNAQNFDHLSNDQVNELWKDRFGVDRLTWHGMEKRYQEKITSMGWSLIDSFQDGAILTRADQALRWPLPDGDGEYYRWDGAFPKSVLAGSTPETTGGVGVGAWIGIGDATLRAALVQPVGSAMIGGATFEDIRYYNGNGKRINCIGRELYGDGGEGNFILDVHDTSNADNDGTILIDAIGRRWKRQVEGDVYFKWWGPDLTGGNDVISKLNAASSFAAYNKKKLILPSGVIGVSDEFVPADGLEICGYGNSLASGNANSTVIKWIGPVSTKKAVIRCSRSPVGETPTEPVNGVRISNLMVDADNKATHGFYFRYFTNESHCDQITAVKARECGIAIYQSWFCSFGTIVAHDNYGQGVVIGYPIVGETGDLGVQSVNFSRIRTHTNGLTHNFVPDAGSPTRYKGAGLITRSNGCTYNNIQSEQNFGFGWIETSPRSSNEFGSYYTEFNGVSDGSNGYGFLCPDDIGGQKSTVINSVTLFSREQFINESEKPVCITNFSKAVDAFNSVFSGSGGFRILGGNSEVITQYQSESNWAQTLYAIPYTLFRSKFILNSTSSLYDAVYLPPGTTNIKIHVLIMENFSGSGKFNINGNGALIASYDITGPVSAGFTIEKDISGLTSQALILSMASTTITTAIPAIFMISIGRFNNGDYSKLFKFR